MSRFMFDQTFDESVKPGSPQALAAQQRRMQMRRRKEEREKKAATPQIDRAMLEAVRREAFDEGVAKGRAQGLEFGRHEGYQVGLEQSRYEAKQIAQQLLTYMAGQFDQVAYDYRNQLIQLKHDMAKVALAIAERLAPNLMRREPLAELEGMIEEVLRDLGTEPRAILKVHPDVVEILREKVAEMTLASGYEGQVLVFGDASFDYVDGRVEWVDGGAERRLSSLMQAVETSVNRYLGVTATEDDTPLPSIAIPPELDEAAAAAAQHLETLRGQQPIDAQEPPAFTVDDQVIALMPALDLTPLPEPEAPVDPEVEAANRRAALREKLRAEQGDDPMGLGGGGGSGGYGSYSVFMPKGMADVSDKVVDRADQFKDIEIESYTEDDDAY